MKVILQEPVDRLGNVGDLVSVANGYARNYLIPTGLAIEANEGNVKYQKHHQRVLEKKRLRLQAKGEELKARIESISLDFERKVGEKGKLFGSVTNKDIADALLEKGIEVDRRKIDVPEPIKAVGSYVAVVAIQPGIAAEITVQVAGDQESQALLAEQEAAESESVPVEEAVAEVEDESPAEAVDEQEL
ncbi:MAG: 50S ribosomal protein L9 [Deltaproteobacteria bacterium]|nr:MAG: 50S ribosomal protein L9 [Deltaproteobacteria bacterium]